MSLRKRQQQNANAASLRRIARPQTQYGQRNGSEILVNGNPVRAQNVTNEPLGTGDSILVSGDSGLTTQERRQVTRAGDVGRSLEVAQECVLPGIMVYQNITTFYRPASSYAALDDVLSYKEKIIWFSNNGAPVTLYEAGRTNLNPPTGYLPETQFNYNTRFWANTDGTGQVCFQYEKVLAGEDYYDIWDLSDSGATLRETIKTLPGTQYKGGSLGIGSTSTNPGLLLRETPRTTYNSLSGVGYLDINGVQYLVKERTPSNVLQGSNLNPWANKRSYNLSTMAKAFAIRYGLSFDIDRFIPDSIQIWTINGNVAALIQEQVYTLEGNDYVSNVEDFTGASPPRPPKLNVGNMGNFKQPVTLSIPPYVSNEHYWVSSKVPVSAIVSQEGLGSTVRIIGSYFNASKNCLIQNGTTLEKTPIGRPFIPPPDPNAPI